MDEDSKSYRRRFFMGLVITQNLITKYMQCTNDKERLILASKIIVQNSKILLDSECEQKNSPHSIKSREDGNRDFVRGQYYQAVKKYTESIAYALDSSEELALAYANRSAALFELKKYAECVEDIDRTLNLEYPDKLKTKLYKRKGLCLTALGRPMADSSFQEALFWLDKMTLSKDRIDQNKSELKKLISTPCATSSLSENVKQYPLPEILSPNSELPCASDAVALKYSKEFGRYLVATRKIKPGEILVVENPYCMKVYSKNVYTHCSYCLQASWNMIPCNRCVNAAYCSDACRVQAWDKYHEMECPVMGLLFDFNLDEMLWTSMRMTIMATQKGKGLDALKQELINIDHHTDPRSKGYHADGKFHSDRYSSIYTLACDTSRCPGQTLLNGALWLALAVCVLARETDLVGEKLTLDTWTENPNVMFVWGLMLKNAHICFMNLDSYGATRSMTSSAHGHALMTVGSLLNHSCDPNILRQWYPNFMAVSAAFPIEKDEQIFSNYGPHYVIRGRSDRQNRLAHWNFKCSCRPCTENWPLLNYLPSYKDQLMLRTDDKKVKKVIQKLIKINEGLLKNGIKEITPSISNVILEVIETLSTLVTRPCKELASAVGMLETFYGLADAMFDYEPITPSSAERQYILSYIDFKNVLSQY